LHPIPWRHIGSSDRRGFGAFGENNIDLYYWPTPNGWKASIMLEEVGPEYEVVQVDIEAGDQFEKDFLRISPNNKMPAIVDHDFGYLSREVSQHGELGSRLVVLWLLRYPLEYL
jgi:hypothetical protein